MQLYVTGGREKKKLFKSDEEWTLYESGIILGIDSETGTSKICMNYVTPPDARAGSAASVAFKTGVLQDNRLHVCTSTEVLTYSLPGFRVENYISLPCFNDLHYVAPTPEGTLLVVSTGLDLVVELDPAGNILREWNVLGEDPWQRFSRDIDYRKVLSTKPHGSHPNFTFQLGRQIWVTRFLQKDAICLTEPGLRIDIGLERVHDGLVRNGKIYFTTVDGKIVLADSGSLQITEVIDLTAIDNSDRKVLGWCRGLLPLDEQYVWVGFSRVRNTPFKEHLLWLKNALNEGDKTIHKPTHIALYDIRGRKLVREVEVEKCGLNTVFGIYSHE